MANYYATERTNYFLVNNEEGFLEDVQTFLGNHEILRKEKDGKTYFAILGDYENGQGRYVMGYAHAYNWKGEVKTIDLRDIYELAKELGNDITEVEF